MAAGSPWVAFSRLPRRRRSAVFAPNHAPATSSSCRTASPRASIRASLIRACSPKAARTADKKTWLAWRTWGHKDVNGISRYAVRTYLQLLDRDGTDADGLIILHDRLFSRCVQLPTLYIMCHSTVPCG